MPLLELDWDISHEHVNWSVLKQCAWQNFLMSVIDSLLASTWSPIWIQGYNSRSITKHITVPNTPRIGIHGHSERKYSTSAKDQCAWEPMFSLQVGAVMHQPLVQHCRNSSSILPVSAVSGSNQEDEWEPSSAQFPQRKSPALGHCSHLLLQFISFWVEPLKLLMKSYYEVCCKLIRVQKLLWNAGGRCEVSNSFLNQLCYMRDSGTLSKVTFSPPTFVYVMSLNSQTCPRSWWEKSCRAWALPVNLTQALVCKNACRWPR